MALQTTALFNKMVREFTSTTGDTRFQSDFVAALNLCLDEISFRQQLTTAIGHVVSSQTIISEIDEEYTFILNDGLVVKLTEAGRKHQRGDEAYNSAKFNWEQRLGDALIIKNREDQATVDDDGVPTADIIGLGYYGDE